MNESSRVLCSCQLPVNLDTLVRNQIDKFGTIVPMKAGQSVGASFVQIEQRFFGIAFYQGKHSIPGDYPHKFFRHYTSHLISKHYNFICNFLKEHAG